MNGRFECLTILSEYQGLRFVFQWPFSSESADRESITIKVEVSTQKLGKTWCFAEPETPKWTSSV